MHPSGRDVGSPCGKLGADIIRRADEARFCEGAAEDHELAEADGASLFGDPSGGSRVSSGRELAGGGRAPHSSRMETGRHAGLFKVLARRSCHLGFEGCCNIGADERRRRARELVNLHRLLGRRAMEVMTEEVACRVRRQPRAAGERSGDRIGVESRTEAGQVGPQAGVRRCDFPRRVDS